MSLRTDAITKVVEGRTHIKPTTLELERGHFNVLLGPTGSGKTSLIKMMAGLDPIASGRVTIDGEDVTRVSPQRRRIALVHQFFVNYPHMTVRQNIASPLRVAGMARSEIDGRVEEAAALLGLGPMLDRYPHELSGGQQQRTALARAVAKDSRAVFLDEPLANLDYKLREELREQLPELFAGRGAVVVYATSEPEEALLLGGRTALMSDGAVAQFGPTAEIYRAPATLAAARTFSDPPINAAETVVAGGVATLGEARFRAPVPDGRWTFAIRPHHVLPAPVGGDDVAVAGRVIVTELSGSESSAHFDAGFGDGHWVSLAHGVHPYRVGEMHDFHFDPAHGFWFDAGSGAARRDAA